MSGKVRLERHGCLALIVLNRPNSKNAIDLECMEALGSVLEEIEQNEELVCVALTGEGDCFCAGGDVKEHANISAGHEGRDMSQRMNQVVNRLAQLERLTIAALGGDAIGGGCELALACDMRVIAEDARLHFKQAVMGLTPGWGGGQRLARLIGPGRATWIYATAATLSASEAQRLGVVDEVTTDVLQCVRQWADRMKDLSPLSVRNIKRGIVRGMGQELQSAIAYETELFEEAWSSEAHSDAVARFLGRSRG